MNLDPISFPWSSTRGRRRPPDRTRAGRSRGMNPPTPHRRVLSSYDAANGRPLLARGPGSDTTSGPRTCLLGGRQYVASAPAMRSTPSRCS